MTATLIACAGLVLATSALAVWSSRAGAAMRESGGTHDLAAVLVPQRDRCEVVMVDLETMRVVRRVRLRSLATDIAVDGVSGAVATAQSGGLGPEADDAVGLFDPRSGGVRYARLPCSNPGSVACIDGRAYALHGWDDDGRQFVSVVDVRRGAVVATGTVPSTSGVWTAAGGSLWSVAVPRQGASSIVRIAPSDLAATTVGTARGIVAAIAADGPSLRVLYAAAAGDGAHEATAGRVAEIDPTSGAEMRAETVPGLAHGPMRAASANRALAVIDWNGDEPESGAVTLLDGATLRATGAVATGGVPCALASWGGRVLAVDRLGGRLLAIDVAERRVVSSVALGATDLVFSDVEVVGRRRTDAGRAGSGGATAP